MTAKDFQIIADVIAALPDGFTADRDDTPREQAAFAFADKLREVNSRFDQDTFLSACNVLFTPENPTDL